MTMDVYRYSSVPTRWLFNLSFVLMQVYLRDTPEGYPKDLTVGPSFLEQSLQISSANLFKELSIADFLQPLSGDGKQDAT